MPESHATKASNNCRLNLWPKAAGAIMSCSPRYSGEKHVQSHHLSCLSILPWLSIDLLATKRPVYVATHLVQWAKLQCSCSREVKLKPGLDLPAHSSSAGVTVGLQGGSSPPLPKAGPRGLSPLGLPHAGLHDGAGQPGIEPGGLPVQPTRR